jgi:hypothetical protein
MAGLCSPIKRNAIPVNGIQCLGRLLMMISFCVQDVLRNWGANNLGVFSSIGKFLLALVVVGIVIGGGFMFFAFTHINPQIEKLSTLDKINYELEERGEQKISYNILNGAISRE